MALVAAAVANGGEIMTPHVVREVRDDQGEVVDTIPTDDVWTRAMSSGTAGLLRQGMIAVVQDGTASRLDDGLPGFEVGGKTGTAQIGSTDSSHADHRLRRTPPRHPAWPSRSSLRVSRASEQTGGRVAAPIAAAVMRRPWNSRRRRLTRNLGTPTRGEQ